VNMSFRDIATVSIIILSQVLAAMFGVLLTKGEIWNF